MSNTNNLVQGNATLWLADVGAVEPTDLGLLNGEWRELGLLKNGVSVSHSLEFLKLRRDKDLDHAEHKLVSREIKIMTNLAEHTLENYRDIAGGGTINAGDVTTFTPHTTGNFAPKALIVDGFAPNGNTRRIIFRSVTQVGSAEFKYIYNKESVYRCDFSVHTSRNADRTPLEPYIIMDGTD